MKTPRESIAIGDIPTDADAKYPTVVNTNSARAQHAVNGMDRLQDTADHNRWKNAALQSGLDLFRSEDLYKSSLRQIYERVLWNKFTKELLL